MKVITLKLKSSSVNLAQLRKEVFNLAVMVVFASWFFAGSFSEAAPQATSADPAPSAPLITYNTDEDALSKSVHEDLDCTDCHDSIERDDDEKVTEAGEVSCVDCHDEPAEQYDSSIHSQTPEGWDHAAASCQECHGAHDILPISDPLSKVGLRKVAQVCAPCHDGQGVAGGNTIPITSHYLESIHGESLVKEGTVVSPSCVTCHGAHDILASADEASKTNRVNINHTCDQCHFGISEKYEKSVHGKLYLEGNPDAPTCTNCHTSHEIVHVKADFKLLSDQRCGLCHEDRYKQLQQTYHGRARALGGYAVAACFDCHGTHDILPSSDPDSLVASKNRLGTCRKCHENAPPRFAGYLAHGDPTSPDQYPMLHWVSLSMHTLVLAVFFFLILHTMGRAYRAIKDYTKNPAAYRKEMQSKKGTNGSRLFKEVRGVDRFCYVMIIIGFTILAVSGIPLKYSQSPWALQVFALLGGSQIAAGIHRIGAVIIMFTFTIHVGSLIAPLWANRKAFLNDQGKFSLRAFSNVVFGPNSPIPGKNDIKDLWAHSKWIVGRGPKPLFNRFSYWEKFDYAGTILGILVIGMSGLSMWMPEIVTLFLPGWIINISQIIHSNEALMAVVFLITIHIAHFFTNLMNKQPSALDQKSEA